MNTDERLIALLDRIDELLEEAEQTRSTAARGPSSFGWLVSGDNLVSFITGGRGSYHDQARNILETVNRKGDPASIAGRGEIQDRNRTAFARMESLLKALQADCRRGLLTNLEYTISAENFDAFLDLAEGYKKKSKKQESGVLASAVFEDTMRKLGKRHTITERQIDTLIDQLIQATVITAVKGKRLKAAAGVRNKALHAEWDAFDLADVEETIRITREMLEELSK